MAEALGIDKDKPKEAVTVAVKMLKSKSLWISFYMSKTAHPVEHPYSPHLHLVCLHVNCI